VGIEPHRFARSACVTLVALAALGMAGCTKRQPVEEKLDPSELELLPSIIASGRRLVDGAQKLFGPIYRRDAHAKAHGCVMADFAVREDLPEPLRTGVFVPGRNYPAWIRFSNGDAHVQPDDVKDARGMAIKLMDVRGQMLLESADDAKADTQDFVMINHPVFFVRTPTEYERFIRVQADGDSPLKYAFPSLNPSTWRLRELFIGESLLVRIANPLYAQYYSMAAYALGVDTRSSKRPYPYRHAMKYSAKSCTPPDHRDSDTRDDDYLRRRLADHLAESDACFDFLVQVQDPTKNMPIEDPTVRWSECDAPFQKVARIRIAKQTFDTPAQNEFCENLAFTPWHGHVDHRPLGGINRIRKAVYEEIAAYRHARNGFASYREPRPGCMRLDGQGCDAPVKQTSAAAPIPAPPKPQ